MVGLRPPALRRATRRREIIDVEADTSQHRTQEKTTKRATTGNKAKSTPRSASTKSSKTTKKSHTSRGKGKRPLECANFRKFQTESSQCRHRDNNWRD